MIYYTLLDLQCWSCKASFLIFTDLSNHHLAAHERDLGGQPVAVWLARDVTPGEEPLPRKMWEVGVEGDRFNLHYEHPGQCGVAGCMPHEESPVVGEGMAQDCAICHHRLAMRPFCSACGPFCTACATARRAHETWEVTAPRCRQCDQPVPNSPDHLRLQLCAICVCAGLQAFCAVCGENYPEHGLGGRGCAAWRRAPDEPFPGLEDPEPPPDLQGLREQSPAATVGTLVCFCGCARSSHSGYFRAPCQTPGCSCLTFTSDTRPLRETPGEPALDTPCGCGHMWIGHSQGAARQPCAIVGCACAQYVFSVLVLAPPPDVPVTALAPTPPCFCGHAEGNHRRGYWRAPCQVAGCLCIQFTLADGAYSAMQAFQARCGADGLSCDPLDARLLLDTLGVPPDAPAEPYSSAIAEAVDRWRARQGGSA